MKGIIFSPEMIQAVLDNRKTMTRRVIKINGCPITSPKESLELTKEGLIYHSFCSMSGYYKLLCQPGDILWVRETWAEVSSGIIEYKATYKEPYTGSAEIDHIGNKIKWRPSIRMPREAARIFLKVTNVRVERLQDITPDNARAEGHPQRPEISDDPQVHNDAAIDWFMDTWDYVNAKRGYGWDTNPWVWVIEFKRITKEEALRLEGTT